MQNSPFGNFFENKFLYSFVEFYRASIAPFRISVNLAKNWIKCPINPMHYFAAKQTSNAIYELMERLTRNYPKPEFGITHTEIDGKQIEIFQEIVISKTFCHLLHFRKDSDIKLPKLLIVAPMSGHYSTLLRGTVQDSLPFFDVYITDWQNARDIPINQGSFDLDDFIDYCIEFMTYLAPNLSVMAVCQPSVPVSAAIAIMSDKNPQDPNIPDNMILIGGPMDTRVEISKVDHFTKDKDIEWFEHNVISMVPLNYSGFGRDVYPGFLQLAGFMAMNMKRHVGEHIKLFEHLIKGDEDGAEKQIKFYDEYLAVMDLPAEFYLQTIKEVFIDDTLPKGQFMSRGRFVKLEKIKKPALLIIEGEHDDITGRGQTESAINLCSNIPDSRKEFHLQIGVGHYGLFNGSKFRTQILPLIMNFCYKHIK